MTLVCIDGTWYTFSNYEDLMFHLIKERKQGRRAYVSKVDGDLL